MHRIATEVLGLEMLYPISTPKPNSADDLIGFIDSYGRVIVQPLYAAGSFFFEGKASVVDWNGKSGFIDNTGNLAIPCEFQGLGNFKDGLCAQSGGYIDHVGDWFIEPRFIVASDFSEGRAFASTDGESFGFIDFSGNFVVPLEFQRCCAFSSGLAAVLREDRWGYIDHEGETRIPHVFEGPIAQPFRYGVAGVQIDGQWGFIGPTGDFVISPEYERVKPFAEGYAPVRRNGKWGLINLDATVVADFLFDDLENLNGGLSPAKMNGKCGFVSSDGSWVIRPDFDKCYRFFGMLAVARKGDVYSYLRRNGEAVWKSQAWAIVQHPPAGV